MSSKKWIRLSLVLLAIVFSVVISFNYYINPYNVFDLEPKDGISKVKNRTISLAMSKFYAAKKANPDVLLIGTSRTQHLHPKYLQPYVSGKIYNLAVSGSGVSLHKKNIEYFVKNYNVKTIIYGVDFFSFNPHVNRYNENLEKTRYLDNYYDDYLNSLFSFITVRRSVRTLKDNLKNIDIRMDYSNGWESFAPDYKEIEHYGIDKIEEKIKGQLEVLALEKEHFNNEKFKDVKKLKEAFLNFDSIVEFCKENNVELKLFISPIYYEIPKLIYSRGYGKAYDYWKSRLAEKYDVYDFSNYNSVNIDKSYYIDGSHIQFKISPYIFARLFDDESNQISDFGVKLTPSRIENFLSNNKKLLFNK